MSHEKSPEIVGPDYDRMKVLKAGDPVTAYVGFPEIQRRIIEEDFFREQGLDTTELDPNQPIIKISVDHG